MPIVPGRTASPRNYCRALREGRSPHLRRQTGYDHSYYFISTSWPITCAGTRAPEGLNLFVSNAGLQARTIWSCSTKLPPSADQVEEEIREEP